MNVATPIFRSFHRTTSSTADGWIFYIIRSNTVSILDLKDAILFLQCLFFSPFFVYISMYFLHIHFSCVLCISCHLTDFLNDRRSQCRLI